MASSSRGSSCCMEVVHSCSRRCLALPCFLGFECIPKHRSRPKHCSVLYGAVVESDALCSTWPSQETKSAGFAEVRSDDVVGSTLAESDAPCSTSPSQEMKSAELAEVIFDDVIVSTWTESDAPCSTPPSQEKKLAELAEVRSADVVVSDVSLHASPVLAREVNLVSPKADSAGSVSKFNAAVELSWEAFQPSSHVNDDLNALVAQDVGTCAPSVTLAEGDQTRSVASSEPQGDCFFWEDDDDAEVDLAKLCSAFCHLERSAGRKPVAESSIVVENSMDARLAPSHTALPNTSLTSSHERHFAQASHFEGRVFGVTGTRSCGSNAVPTRCDDEVLEHFAAGPNSVGSRSLASVACPLQSCSPVENQNHAGTVPEPSRPDNDAQRLDAWIQRVIAKGSANTTSVSSIDVRSKSPLIPPHPVVGPTVSPLEESQMEKTKDAQENEIQIKEDTNVMFELEVELSGDVLGTLKFSQCESLESTCKAFVTEHHLRPIFLAPLETHAELMIHMFKTRDSVDIIDLI